MSSTALPIPADEASLVDALCRGDQAAYLRLVTEFGPRMRAVIRRYVRDDADADDALQDAFISASRAIDRFQRESSLSTWLHTIAVRAALMKLRSRKRMGNDAMGIDELLPRYNLVGHRVSGGTAAPVSDQLQSLQTQEIVRQQIDKLPEMYRSVLLARDIEQMSTQEASEALEMPEPALKSRLHRARAALRTLLEPYIRSNSI